MTEKIGIALIGAGTVGGGVADLLARRTGEIAERSGFDLQLRRVVARNSERAAERIGKIAPTSSDWRAAVADPNCTIIVELIGGTDEALECARATIAAGKPLVTANKSMLAEHGSELFAAARSAGTGVYFEAAVAACIPVIKVLRESLVADRIVRMRGIVNGTCNYIMSEMAANGTEFEETLTQALALGYAETDPRLDVDGWDAAHKAVIAAWLAFGTPLAMTGVPVNGIRQIKAIDEKYAESFGYRIKMIATASTCDGNEVEIGVGPELVDSDHILATIGGCMNALLVESEAAGELIMIGAGAGAAPTATAVLADVVAAARECTSSQVVQPLAANGRQVLAPERRRCSAYMRVTTLDQPGMMAKITGLLAQDRISIQALHQSEAQINKPVDLVILLHENEWGAFMSATERIDALKDAVQCPTVLLPIAIPHTRWRV